MFPMIASLEEFLEARQALRACIEALAAEAVPHNANPKIGMMVEVPAVVELIDAFAREADFFAIGTNDFIQYTLAADRTNERVARFYMPHHPSVLRAIARVVEAARHHNREVSVCGDMAHEERYLPFFLGIGVRALSVDPPYLPRVQRAIGRLTVGAAETLAREVLAQTTVSAIGDLLAVHAPRLGGPGAD
jgi:phosphotransferase system enzyme I (PtsP)